MHYVEYLLAGTLTNYENMLQEILFDNIHRQIVYEVRKAKYVIWIVMTWFRSIALFGVCNEERARSHDSASD